MLNNRTPEGEFQESHGDHSEIEFRCNVCLNIIDPATGYFGREFKWSTVGEMFLCHICIEEILTNYMYAHLNNKGEFI